MQRNFFAMNKAKKYNLLVRVLFSILLTMAGILMVILWPPTVAHRIISDLGLAFIVAGAVSTFHEAVIRRIEGDEGCRDIAERVHEKFRDHPLIADGIRLVSPVRKGFHGYYQWAVRVTPDEMFFAGRSVLHRFDHDLKQRGIGSAEEALARRLNNGAKIRIMFLDPRSNLLPRLAREEGQKLERMLTDIATSIGISVRLYRLLQAVHLPPQAHLEICVYDEVPYFAYHSVASEAIAGFYFSSFLGHSSAAYELVDSQTKSFFEGHFVSMLERARSTGKLLQISQHRAAPDLDAALLEQLRNSLISQNIPIDELIPDSKGAA